MYAAPLEQCSPRVSFIYYNRAIEFNSTDRLCQWSESKFNVTGLHKNAFTNASAAGECKFPAGNSHQEPRCQWIAGHA